MKKFTFMLLAALVAVMSFAQLPLRGGEISPRGLQTAKAPSLELSGKIARSQQETPNKGPLDAFAKSMPEKGTVATSRAPRKAETVTPPAGTPENYVLYGVNRRGGENYNSVRNVKVVMDGNDVYMTGLSWYLPNAWVKGTISGSTVTFPAGQYMGNAGVDLYFGGYDSSGIMADVTATYDAAIGEFVFSGYLLDNGYPSNLYIYDYWYNLRVTKGEVVNAPDDLVTEDYVFISQELSIDNEGNPVYEEVSQKLKIGFDGTDVYFQGLCTELPEAWVKGVYLSTYHVVGIPTGQYLGAFRNAYPMWYVGYGPNGIGHQYFDYDEATGKFDGWYWSVVNEYKDSLSYYHVYTNIELKKVVERAATPAAPSITGFTPYDEDDEFGSVDMNIPVLDTNKEGLVTSKLSYQLFTDEEHVIKPLVLTTDLYMMLDEDMSVIPYDFTDDWDIEVGGKYVFLNAPTESYNRIGVKSIYTGGGETHESEIAWYDIKDFETPFADGKFYLYNGKKFLSRGGANGTTAAADNAGLAINVERVGTTGANYSLQGVDNEKYYGGTSEIGTDSTETTRTLFTITPPEGLAEGGYYVKNEAGKYIGVDADNQIVTLTTPDATASWQFLTPTEHDEIVAANLKADSAAVFAAAGVKDLDALSPGAETVLSFKKDQSQWKYTATNGKTPVVTAQGTELKEATGQFALQIDTLTKGLYKVSIQALFRDGKQAANANISTAYLLANGINVPVKSWGADKASATNPKDSAEAATLFAAGKYRSEAYVFVDKDGVLDLKVVVPSYIKDGWFVADNVTFNKVGDEIKHLDEYQELLDEAVYLDGKMSKAAQDALDEAVQQQVSDGTAEERRQLTNAYFTLEQALEQAKASIAAYAHADSALQEKKEVLLNTNFFDQELGAAYEAKLAEDTVAWQNGDLADADAKAMELPSEAVEGGETEQLLLSAWTTEADTAVVLQSEQTFKAVPFVQYAVADTLSLAATTLSAVIDGMEMGEYTLTAEAVLVPTTTTAAAARAAAEAATKPAITASLADGDTLKVAGGALTLKGRVRKDGVLTLAINVPDSTGLSALQLKNIFWTKTAEAELTDLLQIDPAEGEVDSLQHFTITFGGRVVAVNEAAVPAIGALSGTISQNAAGDSVFVDFAEAITEPADYVLYIPEYAIYFGGTPLEPQSFSYTVVEPVEELEDLISQPVTAPEGLETEEYTFEATYRNSNGSSSVERIIHIGFDGNDVYVQGLSYYLEDESWIKGKLNADKTAIVFQSPQYYGSYAGQYDMYFIGNLYYDDDNDLYPTKIEVPFDAETRELTLPAELYILEGAEPVNDWSCYGYYYNASITKGVPELPDVVTAPEGLQTDDFVFKATEHGVDSDGNATEQVYSADVKIGTDGDTVYVQGLCKYLPEAWVKGVKSGNTVTFTTGQYYGSYAGSYDMFLVGYGAAGIIDVVLTYNENSETYTTTEYLLLNGKQNAVSYYNYYTNVVLEKKVKTAISNVNTVADGEKTFYNLQGQKVDGSRKGLYIVNGKKVVVK